MASYRNSLSIILGSLLILLMGEENRKSSLVYGKTMPWTFVSWKDGKPITAECSPVNAFTHSNTRLLSFHLFCLLPTRRQGAPGSYTSVFVFPWHLPFQGSTLSRPPRACAAYDSPSAAPLDSCTTACDTGSVVREPYESQNSFRGRQWCGFEGCLHG